MVVLLCAALPMNCAGQGAVDGVLAALCLVPALITYDTLDCLAWAGVPKAECGRACAAKTNSTGTTYTFSKRKLGSKDD